MHEGDHPDATPDAADATTAAHAQAAEDVRLVSAVAQGDAVAFRRLVDLHLGACVATGRRLLDEVAESEDVAQEAFLRLWGNAATLQVGPNGIRPWLRRVTANLAIDRLRARRSVTPVDEVPDQPVRAAQEDGLVAADLTRAVQQALADLPERQRVAISLFHFEGLSQVEVGRAMGVSDEAVESLLGRGRRALRAALRGEWRALLPDQQE
jgi:RNA polymerase sigma-70 factor (ECF subfamily)